MCGIAGFVSPGGGTPEEMRHCLTGMIRPLIHRGPDDEGVWIDAEAGVALGFRRLSILDLSEAGHQPMVSSCGRYVLVSNQEIYNFRDLRRDLMREGRNFRGQCDTEVLLETISRHGVFKALEVLEGMWGFAVWDRQERLLHLCRDRIGEKPLYYGWSGGVFLFGSELKAITEHPSFEASIDRDALALYIQRAYVPAPYSIYCGIRKVMPGTVVTLEAAGHSEPSEHTYWSCRKVAEQGLADPFAGSAEDAEEQLANLLEASVKLRMQADVPVGAFLSGGYDSSLIVSLMRRVSGGRIRTFTLGFEQNDEVPYARNVARHLSTDHTEAYASAADALDLIPQIPKIYDEPFSDSSQIPTFLISKLARSSVSVILTGDAGDELFCGYARYDPARYPGVNDRDRMVGYFNTMAFWRTPVLLASDGKEQWNQADWWLSNTDFCHQLMYHDLTAYLPDDLLVKLDRAAMAVSLETRVPFLDRKVMEVAWRIPLAMKLDQGRRKWILRRILYRYVPPELVDRPKQGFSIPLLKWLRGPLRDWAEALLDERRLRHDGYFDAAVLRNDWANVAEGHNRLKHGIWAVLMFQAWLDARASGSRVQTPVRLRR